MAKQLNVNLAFTADTSQAKAQLQALQNSLTSLMSTTAISTSGLGIDEKISSAIAHAGQLKIALEQATNVKTGTLDLGKFDQQLKKSGMSIDQYAKSLYALGPKGAQAFSQLAQSITTAEIPLRRGNAMLQQFATTLKNTARWQISSSILHGFMGAIQSAYGYAKDLNESLNDIRIVTSQSTEQMAKFAKEANSAAKALSTTTTEYTKASLIFYQQGLNDDEVKERTDATIKMANVTGQTAETVSDQMTAVWNNFDDGSKSLEYYADVMTALGAATASSTDEIAQGLEKFAAVSETVGLSYEYATSALATVTATTRQSADVVGTAFKTLFARIQGLKLGETLDDGTTLNQYSEALAAVGINIKTANGDLRDMDSILNEMGSVWKDLNEDEQVALAQKVAGVRQYTQLVALMDNWDYFQENLNIANSAEGTLQIQADIYAESWEAAADRVKASLETIYGQLLDDDFFIGLLDGVADVIDGFSELIDMAGGLKGVLLILSTVLMRTFGDSMAKELERIAFNFSLMGKNAKKSAEDIRTDTNKALKSLISKDTSVVGTAQNAALKSQSSLQEQLIQKNRELLKIGKQITEEEQKQVAQMLDLNRAIGEQLTKTAQRRKEEEETTKNLIAQATQKMRGMDGAKDLKQGLNRAVQQQNTYSIGSAISTELSQIAQKDNSIENLKKKMVEFKNSANEAGVEIKILDGFIEGIESGKFVDAQDAARRFELAVERLGIKAQNSFDQVEEEAAQAGANIEQLRPIIQKVQDAASKGGQLTKEEIELLQRLGLQAKDTGEKIDGLKGRTLTAADGFVALGSSISQIAMTVTILKSTIDTFKDEDSTWLDKLTAGAMLLGTAISTLTFVFGAHNREALAAIPISLATALGFKGVEVSANGATKSVVTLGGALSFLGKNPYVWAISIAIGAIVTACVLLYKSRHKAQKAFETLDKGAKDATASMQEIKTEVEGLSTALDDLSEKTKALDDLTYGTSEWAKAMSDVNEEVQDLIDNYDLEEFNAEGQANYYRDDRGVMHLTDSGRKEIADKAEAKMENATIATNSMNYARNKAEVEAEKEKLRNSRYAGSINAGTVSQEVDAWGVPVQAENTGNNWDVKPTQTGAPTTITLNQQGIEEVVRAVSKGLTKDDLTNVDAMVAAGVSQAQAELIASNSFLQGELYNLGIATQENTEAHKANTANELINDDKVYKAIYGTTDSEGNNVDGIAEEYRSSALEQMANDIVALESQFLNNIQPEEVTEEKSNYAKAFDYGEQDGKYYKKDENGNILTDQEVTISDDAVKQWMAHNKAVTTAKNNIEKYTKAVEDSNKVWAAADKLKEKAGEKELSLWEKTKKALEKYNGSYENMDEESQKAVKETQGHLQELLRMSDDVAEDLLTPEFIQENSSLIEDAIHGDVEALNALQTKAAEGVTIDAYVATPKEELSAEALELMNYVDSSLDDIEIGASLDNTEVLKVMNQMLEDGQITGEKMQEYLGMKGFKGVELKTKTVTRKITIFEKLQSFFSGHGWPSKEDEKYTVPYVVGTGETGDSGTQGDNTRSAPSGIDTSTILEKTDPATIIDSEGGDTTTDDKGGNVKVNEGPPDFAIKRYKEVDDQLDNISKKMSKVNRESEQLYGAAKVSKMKENIQLMKKEVELLKQKEAEAKAYLALDKAALDKAAADAGIHFTYNDDGTIANYTEQMNIMQKRLENAYAAAGSTISDSEQKLIDAIAKHIETLNDAISDYDDSLNTMEEQADAVLESLDNVMRENYSVLTYELELKLEIDEAALQEIEFAINQLSDDFYKMAEIASLMIDQIDPYSNQLETLGDHFTALTDAFEDGEIAQEDYIDGLKETRDSIYDQLNALVDLDKEMMEYYGNTLDAAMEELDKYTDHMEHLTGVIDHYISLMELMGKSTDFETMDEFLSARAETTKNELDVAKSNYEMLARQKEQIEERMAGTREGSAEWELYKKEWDAIVATMDEAQDEMLSKTEEWMEAMKAVIENNMNKAAKSLEDALTNGMSFDHMMTELDRLNERQEEYLTKTNQVYETNKLMRQAAQAADKTDNAVAKQKFKNFAEETKQLQEKGQLSKYELEIQQAKYDLLLAEIALEDAQNAKSTVRLQRDSEGNFGYVYTADQDKISDAQQAVEDAENDLYNISLEGQQDYTEKYTQALQSMYDEMKALQEAYLNGDIATEQEYQARKEALMQHYFGVPDGILTTYSNLYNVAVQTDANATADFWAKSYGDMTADTEEFKTAVNGYLVEVETETEAWHDITKAAQEDITEGLDDLVDESEEYADVVDDEVIPALEDELDAVEDLTAGYADQRDEVLRLIQTYKQLVQAINAAIAAAARQSGSSRSSSGDLSLDAANAFVAGEDTSGILAERGEKMANGNHPIATDNDTLVNLFKDAEKNPGGEADKIIQDVAAGNSQFHDHKLDKWSFDTGGYTGEWGPQAKLAFVHEKEIMLNSDDTVNFLSAIKITRSIMELIDKQAGWASAGLGVMSASGVQDYNQVLEQEVTIHAEFPNATDHNEIEEAFNNLMNTASQYANRKNR